MQKNPLSTCSLDCWYKNTPRTSQYIVISLGLQQKDQEKKHCWPGGCPFKWCFSVNITDCSKSVSRFIKMTTCIFGWPFYFKRNYIFSLFWLKIQMPNQLFCPNSALLSLFLICFYFFKLSYPKVVSCLFLVKTQHSKSTFLFLKHSSVLISSPLLTCYLTRVNWSLLSQLSSTSVKSMFCRVSSRCAMYPLVWEKGVMSLQLKALRVNIRFEQMM